MKATKWIPILLAVLVWGGFAVTSWPGDGNITTSTLALVRNQIQQSSYVLMKTRYVAAIENDAMNLPNTRVDNWLKRQDLRDAKKTGDHRTLIELLEPIIARNPDRLCMIPAYQHVGYAYGKLNDSAHANKTYRQGIASIRNIIDKNQGNGEYIFLCDMFRRYYDDLTNYSDEDYLNENSFYTRILNVSAYKDWRDVILNNMCSMEYRRARYDQVIALCAQIDEFYQTMPEPERNRVLQQCWKARAMFKQGKREDGIALMEQTKTDPWGIADREAIKYEMKLMESGKSLY